MTLRRHGCRSSTKMPCESCAVQFSVFKRKRVCCECERYYCSGCLRRGGGAMCAPCRVLSTRPLSRQTIAHLKVRDLQCFLHRQNVSTRGCVEKEELVNLCVSHVNSASYRRRGSRGGNSPFSSLKGLTNNINDFIYSAFDLRTAQPAPPPPSRSCFNNQHAHSTQQPSESAYSPNPPLRHRFTVIRAEESEMLGRVGEVGAAPPSRSSSAESPSARVDTADCYEIEDLDEGWEFVSTPADPLPNDSDVLLRATEPPASRVPEERAPPRRSWSREPPGLSPGPPARAASELELRQPDTEDNADTASLRDEPLMDSTGSPKQVDLSELKEVSQLEALSVKQLKELLGRNRVEYRGCLERRDLLERARLLWRDHQQFNDEVDNLPIEECCKICMAAPLECVLLECGHIAACTACSKQLAECPICRQYVVRAVRFFRS